ncbi:hypothetical protein DSLASN_26780 [Desulfoluna limicola]|uniref:Uncharacterized protein n=1 Tax=Desulfoluna limicola TaxID=2810562 RepID=A0ABM7PHK3_9BACT|nr:hypothetical protein [Desulfoluna limicola]BCS97046.1 hypothetical protein DSLASN_26780 [Desulfoluna limicola]
MSHTFSIRSDKPISLGTTLDNLPISGIKIAESDEVDNSTEPWPAGYLHLYIDGVTCRSIELLKEGDRYDVRIMAASSVEDALLAIALSSTLAKELGAPILPEDGEELPLDSFEATYDRAWAGTFTRNSLEMVLSLCESDQGPVTLQGVHTPFEIGPRLLASLPEAPQSRQDAFFALFRKHQHIALEDVFPASKIIVTNEGRTRKCAVVVLGEGVLTLLPTDAHVVALSSDDGSKLQISMDAFLPLVEPQGQWLSETALLIEPIMGKAWQDLSYKARPHHLKDLFAAGDEMPDDEPPHDNPRSGYREIFSDSQWTNLAYAPFIVFLIVSAADGTIDKKEIKAFGKVLGNQSHPLTLELLASMPDAPHAIIQELLKNPLAMAERLESIVTDIDDKLPRTDALLFKVALFNIGQEVAEASGGFFGFGKKISKKEKAALTTVALMLNVT